MSAHIVFAVPCLWQGGIHSLQGLPSILLIKQWLCTQPIQGRENATQRDKNIKHLAIWGGKVPNNDSLVIMEAQFFFPLITSPKNVWRRNSATINLCVHVLNNFILHEKVKSDMKLKKRKTVSSNMLIDLKPLLPPLTHSMQFIFLLLLLPPGLVKFLTPQRLVIKIEIFTT